MFCLYFCVLSLTLILCGYLRIFVAAITYHLIFFNLQDLITEINILYFIINITSHLLLLLLLLLLCHGCLFFMLPSKLAFCLLSKHVDIELNWIL
jgi:hypothetical protein